MLVTSLAIDSFEIVRIDNEDDADELLKIVRKNHACWIDYVGSGIYGINSVNVYQKLNPVEARNLLSMQILNLAKIHNVTIEIKGSFYS